MNWRFILLLVLSCTGSAIVRPAVGQGAEVVPSFAKAGGKWPALLRAPFVLLNNLPVVQATVDGRTGNFILDTGAEVSLLNQRYFAGVPTATPSGSGATGALQQTATYRVSRFAWQGLVLLDVRLTATDLTHLGAAPLLGLLGADLLTPYAVTLDYATQTLVLRAPDGPQPLPPPRLTLPFTQRGHLPLIPVCIAGQTYALTIDSGASVNMLDQSLLPDLQQELTNLSTTSLGGTGTQRQAVTRATLTLATLANGLPLRDMETVFTTIGPLARSRPTPILGILGYEFLRQYQVTINYPKRVIELR